MSAPYAYDYDAQCWLEGPAATELLACQLAEEIILLSDPTDGPTYAAMIGVDRAQTLSLLWHQAEAL